MDNKQRTSGGSAIDEVLLDKLRQDVLRGVEGFLDDEMVVKRTTAVQLAKDIANHGAIVAYRDEVRTDALNAFLRMDEIALTDIGAIAELQRAVTNYLSVERFIQLNLSELDRLASGELAPEEGDDDAEDD